MAERAGRRAAAAGRRRRRRRVSGSGCSASATADRQHERYGRAWVTCLPSTHDSFGMALLESLACGTPLVATTDSAPQELVARGRHRRAVPAGRSGRAGRRLPARAAAGPPARDRPACRASGRALRLGPGAGAAVRAAVRAADIGSARSEPGTCHRRRRLRRRPAGRRSLLADGRAVHALVRETGPVAGGAADGLRPVHDRRRGAGRRRAPGAEAVVHLAGRGRGAGRPRPVGGAALTVVATERLAEAARAAGVGRLVYLSTVHVYGARMAPGVTLTEDLRAEPRSAYAISRLACEHVAAGLAGRRLRARGPAADELGRGARAIPASTAGRWSPTTLPARARSTGRLRLQSAGTQWRDFVALDDVCAAITAACRSDGTGLAPGTYNFGSGSPTTVLALAARRPGRVRAADRSAPRARRSRSPSPIRPAPTGSRSSGSRPTRACARRPRCADAVSETVGFCLDHREEL